MVRAGWLGLIWLGQCLVPVAGQGPGVPVDLGRLRHFDGVAPRHVDFDRVTIEDGLSQGAVHALLQDREGFLWVGTKDGLNRYDGYAFTVYRHDPFDGSTLSSSYVTAILEDSRGRLWVGTQDGGLNRFERGTGTAVRYENGPRHRITALAEDARGALWIGTAGAGAYRLRRSVASSPGAQFDRFAHVAGDARSLSDDRVGAILADRRGRVWIGTESGLNRRDAAGRGFTVFQPRPGVAGALSDGFITALAETRDGELWAASPLGLDRILDPESGSFEAHPFPVQRRGYGWGSTRRIGEDPAGRLWLATADGLARFHPRTGVYTFFLNDPLDTRSLGSNFLSSLWWDRTGVLWIGTNGYGLSRHDVKTARFQTLRRPPDRTSRHDGFSVRALLEDSDGFLWISAGLLYRYDRRTGELISFESTSQRVADFGNTGVWSMTQDRRGVLWFGSYEGLFRYDGRAGRAWRYAHDPARADGLPEKVVYGVFEDSRGALWAVTAHFIARLEDAATGRFRSFRHTPASATDEGEALFPAIHEDARGLFWIATDHGLVHFDPRTGALRRYTTDPTDSSSLSHNQVRSIAPAPGTSGRILWIGTAGGGLNRLDVAAGTFTRLTERDGLPNNVVYAVLPDGDGRLWLSTNRGLARYDPRSGAVATYDARDGLQSNEFNAGAYARGPGGRLYFGGINGVTAFDPQRLVDNRHVPPVVITGFRRAGRPEVPGALNGVLERSMSDTDTLRLSYRDNVFTFEFAALDFSSPGRNRYSYRMEGFDVGWTEPSADRTATYTNLPPGRYTFRVRGSNNDGLWNTQGASLAVFIAAPWWRTWWAYAGYAFLAAGAIWMLARYRRKRLLLKHRLEIESLEAEKLRELDRARSRFFANVSHEFRTPLTLTLGPLDDLKSGLHGDLPAPMAEQIDLARRNAGRVLELINQILDVARLEARRMPLLAQNLDLVSFTAGCVRTFAPLAERKGLTLDVQVPQTPVRIWADPGHLEKVLANLLSNALKFTPAGGTVRVSVSSHGPAARVDVRDSGPGIPASDLPHVFDRFYRVDEASTRGQPGTGIGLALAKELVDLHAGSLTVTSEEGFGSTFTVTLPLGRSHLAPEQVAEEPFVEGWTESVSVQPDGPGGDGVAGEHVLRSALDEGDDVTTVLVVDDNAEVRAYVRRHLEPDYRVVEAADGADGLSKARELLPDLVVSDVMMPDLDGIELCGALKGDPETGFIPIILLTARAAPEDRMEGLREHCDDYLTKPFNPDELRVRIENLIDQRRRLRERFAVQATDATRGTAGLGPLHPDHIDPLSADAVFLERVRGLVDSHLGDDSLSVERLAAGLGMSRAHLHRRLRELLDQSPSEVIRGMRLERAADLLGARAGSVSEVAYAVGFKSVAHFSNAFRARYGCRPSAYAAGMEGVEG